MTIQRKHFHSHFKVDSEGKVRAVIATLGVIDKDGDVTMPGFFGRQEVVILPAHDWKHVPLGKGTVKEEGDQAILEAQFNLDSTAGLEWFKALKFDMDHGKPLQQWSYGFTTLEGGSSFGTEDGKSVRYLKPLNDGQAGAIVHEASPVVVGAGEGTRTLAVKEQKDNEDQGLKFSDQSDAALAAVKALVDRAQSLAELRAKQGRGLSSANVERLKALVAGLDAVKSAVEALVVPKEPEGARRELARTARLIAGA